MWQTILSFITKHRYVFSFSIFNGKPKVVLGTPMASGIKVKLGFELLKEGDAD